MAGQNKVLKAKAVIVGAGISGISAALHLLENDYDDFLLMEGNSRIGGRIYVDYEGILKLF